MANWQIALSILAAILGSSVLTALANGWLSRRKTGAETKSVDADVTTKTVAAAGAATNEWQGLYTELKGQITDLRKEITDLHTKIDDMNLAKLKSEDFVALAKELARKETAELVEQMNVLRAEVEKLSRAQAELFRGVNILTEQMKRDGMCPEWTVPSWMVVPEQDKKEEDKK
jgi:TolA-binding protein